LYSDTKVVWVFRCYVLSHSPIVVLGFGWFFCYFNAELPDSILSYVFQRLNMHCIKYFILSFLQILSFNFLFQ